MIYRIQSIHLNSEDKVTVKCLSKEFNKLQDVILYLCNKISRKINDGYIPGQMKFFKNSKGISELGYYYKIKLDKEYDFIDVEEDGYGPNVTNRKKLKKFALDYKLKMITLECSESNSDWNEITYKIIKMREK